MSCNARKNLENNVSQKPLVKTYNGFLMGSRKARSFQVLGCLNQVPRVLGETAREVYFYGRATSTLLES